MTRHLVVESKTSRNKYYSIENLTHRSRNSRDDRITNNENEFNDEHDRQRHSKVLTSEKRQHRRRFSNMGTIFSDSSSALRNSTSTTPSSNKRSNLLSHLSSSRDHKDGHISLSTTTLLNESRSPPPRIKILDLHVEIENKPTLIDETSSSVLKYKTPQFKSHVTFQMGAMDQRQSWKIGWIQACTHMEFFNTYGDFGYTSWEFPEMVTREKPLINDSDGRNYPWYGSSHQVVTINGPITHTSKYTVTMRDFFHPWYAENKLH